ncbi:MAG: glycosyltransferase [Bacteroidota bacterium]
MLKENTIVNGLWIGQRLSPIELLTIQSFLYHGHQFHLWVYGDLDNELPDGMILRDANEIIPERDVFAKKEADPGFNLGKGSFAAPFSDLFRYRLLYLHGGWWVDMDVTCLKPFDFEEPYFFRAHDKLNAIGSVMKCPKGSELMKTVYDRVKTECDENTVLYLLPNIILNEEINKAALSHFIIKGISNEDLWYEVWEFIISDPPIPKEFYFFHWVNEEWRTRGLSKNTFKKSSTLGQLIGSHVIDKNVNWSTLPFRVIEFREWLKIWAKKGKNWLKDPGIPVFVKRYFNSKIGSK